MRNVWCDLETNNEQLLEIVDEECSYEVEGWQHIKKYKLEESQREGDKEKIKYWTDWNGRFGIHKDTTSNKGDKGRWFPTGLLDRILLRFELEVENEKIAILDKRSPLSFDKQAVDYNPSFEPRDYQTDCIEYIKKKSLCRGIIKAPTGSGKTIMGAMLIKENYVPTLIIVDKTVLIKQWKQALLDVMEIPESEIGIVQGKAKFNPSFITIITQQSLNRWRKAATTEWYTLMALHGVAGWIQLIRDEVHRAGSEDGFETMMNIFALLRWGFSATPELRQDQNLKQIGCIGDIIYTIGAERLIEHEFLAKPDIHFLPTERLVFDWHDRYRKVYRDAITFNEKRNLQIVDVACRGAKDKSILVFVDLIEHGKLLEALMLDMAPMYGITAEFVYSNHPDRAGIFERFESRQTNVMIATEGLIGEGYDYKAIDTVIIANGGKSAMRSLQKIGRGMRVTEEKKSVLILDFADRCKYLGAHAKERAGTWRQWGFEPNINQTPWMEG